MAEKSQTHEDFNRPPGPELETLERAVLGVFLAWNS